MNKSNNPGWMQCILKITYTEGFELANSKVVSYVDVKIGH